MSRADFAAVTVVIFFGIAIAANYQGNITAFFDAQFSQPRYVKNDPDTLGCVNAGYHYGSENDDFGSICWLAKRAGKMLADHGTPPPAAAWAPDRQTIRIKTSDGSVFHVKFAGAFFDQISSERF